MKIKFTVTGWETCTQPECNPAFVAKLHLRSECGKQMTLFPVPGETVKMEWDKATVVLTDAGLDEPSAAPEKPTKKKKR